MPKRPHELRIAVLSDIFGLAVSRLEEAPPLLLVSTGWRRSADPVWRPDHGRGTALARLQKLVGWDYLDQLQSLANRDRLAYGAGIV